MLESLSTIDWSQLEHAYGPAADVPGLIHSLASPRPEDRSQALHTLYSNIYHQGTVYEATAYAVPFLIELLNEPDILCKAEILVLLAHLADGYSFIEQHQHFEFTFTQEERTSPEFAERLRREQSWVKKAYDAVSEGVSLYLDLLQHPDPMVRMAAAYLLASLQEFAAHSISLLQSLLSTDRDPSVRASTLLGLGVLMKNDSSYFHLLACYTSSHEPSLVRLVAAMQIARLTCDTPDPDVVQILLDALIHPEDIQDSYAELPWSSTSLIGDICGVLSTQAPQRITQQVIPVLLGILNAVGQSSIRHQHQREAELRQANENNPHHPPEEVLQMAAAMRNIGFISLHNVVHALVHYAFENNAVEDPQALTHMQRTVLTAIIINDAAWRFNGNMNTLLRPLFPSQDRRHLMDMREFIRNLLQESGREEGA